MHVTGQLTLDGTLHVSLIDLGGGLFAPHLGDSFDILSWGTRSGTFNSIQLPTLAGALAWNTSQLYVSGVLSVVSGQPGDYNNNGVVDAADFVVWRKNQGTTNILPNDLTGGTIGTAQYNQSCAHFGQLPGSGSGSAGTSPVQTAVPEPGTLVLLVFAAAGWCAQRGRAT